MGDVADRKESAASHEGRLRPSGVMNLRRTLLSSSTVKPFAEWAGNSFTKLVRRAIRDLALNGYNPAPADTSVAYGMTLGLQLAAQLMEDPSAVYSDVFSGGGGAASAISELEQTFDTAPDEV